MNYRVLQRIICTTRVFYLIVAITGILFSVSPVVAQSALAVSELTLTPTLTHEGLTFSSPLEYESTEATPARLTVQFMAVTDLEDAPADGLPGVEQEKAILVQKTESQAVLAEDIVLPTPKKQLPTETPTPTRTKNATPTSIQTVLAATTTPVVATPEPTKSEAPATPTTSALPSYATNGSLNADVLFSMVNQKRADAGLPAFEKHQDVCSVAEARRPQLENEVYGSSSIHAGFRAMDLAFRASENMISQNSEEAAMNWWMNSSIHRGGVLGGSKYACVVCQNKTCAMIMSSLEPK